MRFVPDIYKHMKKFLSLFGLLFLTGCATEVVYYDNSLPVSYVSYYDFVIVGTPYHHHHYYRHYYHRSPPPPPKPFVRPPHGERPPEINKPPTQPRPVTPTPRPGGAPIRRPNPSYRFYVL